jgi:ABC-type phosphate transport system substrate-binding protein
MKNTALRPTGFAASSLILAGLLFGALVVAPARPARAAEGYKVIVHSSNPATSLSRDQVARYFLKKAPAWPSGRTVAPVDQFKESATREAFSRDVLKKTLAEVVFYWQQQVFSGRAVPPIEKKGDAAAVAFVESNEGAIGYVAAGASVGDAKVLRVE